MNGLLRILRAAHCRSTHHYFAIDALPLVQTPAGQRLKSQLLRHHRRYLVGATDPDSRFRDFQNHVVRVSEGYRGGAPRVAHQWYDRLQRYLRTDRFAAAAHAAGVLTHYFTDPIQPLHTGLCDREKVLHRPIEWSIQQSYEEIYRHWQRDELRIVFQLSAGPGWLGEAILHSARLANRKYDELLTEYDLQRGVNDPREGLSPRLRASLAELFGLSITGVARVLERAAAEAEAARRAPLPTAGLGLATVLAVGRAPALYGIRRITAHRARNTVRRIVDEFQKTGDLVENLPKEIDIVHRVAAVDRKEQRWRKARAARLTAEAATLPVHPDQASGEPVLLPLRPPPSPAANGSSPAKDRQGVPRRFRLAGGDPLISAPHVGPQLAPRFAEIGIVTVQELLHCDPAQTARQLAIAAVSGSTLAAWQTQARLMCQVPGLSDCGAQWIAGAGYTSAAGVATADPQTLYDRITRFAATEAGQRLMRQDAVPPPAEVWEWQRNAAWALVQSQRRAA